MKEKNAYFTLCLLWVMAILDSSPLQAANLPTEFKCLLLTWKNHISVFLSHCPSPPPPQTHRFCLRGSRAVCKCTMLVQCFPGGRGHKRPSADTSACGHTRTAHRCTHPLPESCVYSCTYSPYMQEWEYGFSFY